MRALSLTILALSLSACGGSSKAPEAPAAEPESVEPESAETSEEPEKVEEASGPGAIPTSCHRDGPVCTVDPKWVKKLCADLYPDVALYLFQKSSPFTHGYITRKTKAVNASGGVTSGDEWLAFDEEVVLLYHRAPNANGIQVSGAEGGYDAIRLDGSCVTLDSNEVTLNVPPKAKYATIAWRYLGDDTEQQLKAHRPIFEAYVARKKECKGAFSGEVSKKCVDLDAKLNQKVVSSLKDGSLVLEPPAKRP